MRNASSRNGFSLLELIIYIAILSVVMLVIVGIFLSISTGRGKSESQSEVDSNLRFAVDKITGDLMTATSITTPASAGSASTTLTMATASGTVSYCVVSGTLYRQLAGTCSATSSAITAGTVSVATSTFTRIENTNSVLSKTIVSIQIDMTMSFNATSPEDQFSEEKITTIALLNS